MLLRRKDISQESDEELVSSARHGDRHAMGVIWDRYAHLLYGVAMKYMKEPDMAKDMVVELFAMLPGMLKEHNVKCFRPWIHTVLRNLCLQELRRRKRVEPLQEAAWTGMEDPEDRQLLEYSLQQLGHAIQRLDHQQRICITLFHLERNSYKQIAEITGITVEKVRSNIQNGRRNLRNMLLHNAQRSA
jgi:RNA polymerase sigma factor (sigma-70 family)